MGLPNPSRETKFSGANGDKEKIIFPVQLADREQDWQHCPVVMVMHINKLYTHTAVVTHIYIYAYAAVNRARMCMSQTKNILVPGIQTNTNSSTVPVHIYMYLFRGIQLTTSRFGNLTRLIHITLL